MLDCTAPSSRPAAAPDGAIAEIRICLLPGGRAEMSSTCAGMPDSSYMPRPDADWPAELAKLMAELRCSLKTTQGDVHV